MYCKQIIYHHLSAYKSPNKIKLLLMVQKSQGQPPVLYENLWKWDKFSIFHIKSRISEPSINRMTFQPRRQLRNSWSSEKVDWEYQTWRCSQKRGALLALLGPWNRKKKTIFEPWKWNAKFFHPDQYVTFEKGRFPVKLRERVVGLEPLKKPYVWTLEIGEILRSWETNLRENMLVKLGDNTFCLMQ